jgi:hypothetical protein
MKATPWTTYRTRFLVQAKQLTTSLTFTDALGRQHSGRKGDYLVESSDGVLRVAPRQIFEDIYVPLESDSKSHSKKKSRNRPLPQTKSLGASPSITLTSTLTTRHPANLPNPTATAAPAFPAQAPTNAGSKLKYSYKSLSLRLYKNSVIPTGARSSRSEDRAKWRNLLSRVRPQLSSTRHGPVRPVHRPSRPVEERRFSAA